MKIIYSTLLLMVSIVCLPALIFGQNTASSQQPANSDSLLKRDNEIIKVMEMRNYVIKNGERDNFIQLFRQNFTASQEVLGGHIIGGFEVDDNANEYYWLRGFADMKSRSIFLPTFYYNSESWKMHKSEANNMLVDNDNVLLVRPLSSRAKLHDANTGIKRKLIITNKPFVVVCYYWAKDNKLDNLITAYQSKIKPYLNSLNIKDVTLWVAELAENDFPKLPVIQNKDQFVVLMNISNKEQYNSLQEKLRNALTSNGLDTLVTKQEFLLLKKRL